MPLVLDEVGFRYPGSEWLFRSVTRTFREGGMSAIAGPSGSGKSTLLSLAGGALGATEGSVSRPNGTVAWTFQQPAGLSHRSVLDNVALPRIAEGMTRSMASEGSLAILERLGLEHLADRRFGLLSGGEMQRVSLARALAQRPTILLADEPTAQLDPLSAREVASELHRLRSDGVIVILASHDPAVLEAADDVLDLQRR